VRGLETKEEKGKCLKKAGMIGFLGQVILRTHREIAFQETVRSKLHPRRYTTISDALIAKTSPIFPNRFALPSTKTYPQRSNAPPAPELQPADALSSTQNDAQPETPPPTPPPTPDPPAKIPDLSHFYPNDPTLDPRFNGYHRFPSFPPSARTSLPRQAQDIPACTADFVTARPRIGHTRHDSRGPSHAN
jgi:hypothetical protein